MRPLARLARWLVVTPPASAASPRRADIDELTRLAGRAALHEALAAALRSGPRGVVVLLDVDNFGYFNERHGHRGGDELLSAIGARLREAFPAAGCLARVGGDQFMAFLPSLALAEAMPLAQRCVEAMRKPLAVAGGTEIVTVSAGVATLDGQADRAVAAVWRACDAALHAAKMRGRDRVVAFDGDTRQIVASRRELMTTVAELQERNRALREEARTDALTGLRNRLALDELLQGTAGDDQPRAAVAFIDVDHFGDYNHARGDAAGDEALRAVAHAIRACSREADLVFRKGGEEFVVLLPDLQDSPDNAAAAAERIRAAVHELALSHPASAAAGVVTVTVGVASGPPGTTLRQLLGAAAEKAMAGKVGNQRNRVHAVRLRA
jgi:diguanylate cyclase (GGDEF)-like protein